MSKAATDDEDAGEVQHPRATTVLFGQESAEAALLSGYRSGRVPHAFLIAGPQGIGKATLAYRMARFVLAHPDPAAPDVKAAASLAISPDHPVARRIAAQAQPDLLVIERTLKRQRCAAQADRGRRHPPHRGIFRLDGGRGRLAHRHCRCGRRTQPFRRQCAAQSAGGAAAADLAVFDQPRRVAGAGDAALALPDSHAAAARRARYRQGARRPRPEARPTISTSPPQRLPPKARWRARWPSSTRTHWRCANGRWRCSTASRRSTPKRCMRWARPWPAPDPQVLAAFVDTVNTWLARRLDGGRPEIGRLARLADAWQRVNAARARRRSLQSRTQAAGFQRVRLACRRHPRLIPTRHVRETLLPHHRHRLPERRAAYRARL